MTEVSPTPPEGSAPPAATALPRAHVAHRKRFTFIWAIPLVTLLVGAYLAYDTLSKRGPTITVTFNSAEGLVAGQSQIKHKDIALGSITRVELSKDMSHVVVTAQMTREAEPLLTDQAKLWVVKPRLFAGNVSGLDTLLSGSYVELLPSLSGGKRADDFIGLEDPPVLTSDVPGTTFLLKAARLGAISLGSPVFYRDLTVGQVLGWDFADMADSVTIHAFVRSPFDQYVHEKSRFWNASGLNVKLGAEGIQVQVDSLKAILLGGVAFETRDDARQGPRAATDQVFPLFASQDAASDADFTRRVPMMAYFPGAVDGLGVGSPVTFKGLRVGEVTGISIKYDAKLDAIVVPVTFAVEPERIGNVMAVAHRGPLANLQDLVGRGLRAQLKSTNIVTGQMAIALDMDENAEPAELRVEGGVFVIPTVAGGLSGITRSVNELLNKLTSLPLAQIGANLNSALAGADKITNGPEVRATITALSTTLQSVQDVAKRLDAGASPALRRLPDIASGFEQTVVRANKLLAGLDTGYAAGSPVNRDLTRILVELADAARSVRVLADLLTRHPEALVRGRTNTGAE